MIWSIRIVSVLVGHLYTQQECVPVLQITAPLWSMVVDSQGSKADPVSVENMYQEV
jgi:hypothetical protein